VAESGYQPDQEELTQAFNAHLFGGLAAFIFCGLVFPIAAPLIVFATAKEKRPFMLYHVNQSLIFQGAFFAINAGIATVGGILTFLCIGYFILLLLPITWLIAVIYPLVVGMGAKRGEWTEYPFIGQKLLREWKPLVK